MLCLIEITFDRMIDKNVHIPGASQLLARSIDLVDKLRVGIADRRKREYIKQVEKCDKI